VPFLRVSDCRHLQILLGLGLSAATWIIVTYPTEKTKERLSSDNVQPEMHLVLGTLLPELAVNMEKGLLWTDLLLRWVSRRLWTKQDEIQSPDAE
jgi:hypothetical protein